MTGRYLLTNGQYFGPLVFSLLLASLFESGTGPKLDLETPHKYKYDALPLQTIIVLFILKKLNFHWKLASQSPINN